MTEVSFARTFLATASSRPTKISSEHYEDPKNYPARNAFILPKSSNALPKKRRPLAPGEERTLTVSLKSLRNPPLDLTFQSQSLLLSIHDLKALVSAESSIPASAIKLLYKKKPVGDSKVLKDLVGEDETSGHVELGIMVIGGAAAIVKTQDATDADKDTNMVDADTAQVAQGSSGKQELGTEEFWGDLKGFLLQRLRDEAEGERLYGVFRKAYESQK